MQLQWMETEAFQGPKQMQQHHNSGPHNLCTSFQVFWSHMTVLYYEQTKTFKDRSVQFIMNESFRPVLYWINRFFENIHSKERFVHESDNATSLINMASIARVEIKIFQFKYQSVPHTNLSCGFTVWSHGLVLWYLYGLWHLWQSSCNWNWIKWNKMIFQNALYVINGSKTSIQMWNSTRARTFLDKLLL